MNYRKFRRNVKAISPIISTLLLIAIAVVASLVVYAWVMGYIGFQTSKTGNAVQIQSVSFSPDTGNGAYITGVYVQNVGSGTVSVIPAQCLYVNGALDGSAKDGVATGTTAVPLTAGNTATITPSSTTNLPAGTSITVKVATQDGTYSQVTQQVP